MTRVLIIDDDRVSRIALRRALASGPFGNQPLECVEAATHQEATLALAGRFDLAFVDYLMPGVNGFELVAELRDADVDLPIILVSGSAVPQIGVAGITQGANGFIDKVRLTGENLTRVIDEARQSIQMVKLSRRHRSE